MNRWQRGLAGIFTLFAVSCCGLNNAAAVGRDVPADIFEWVQSTSMAGYYFNKQQICYGVDKAGFIDFNTLIVPTIKIYSAKQIEDVVEKRRWRMERLDGYDKLVGAADYLSIDLAAGTVTVTEHDELDMNWWPLTKTTGGKPVVIANLSEKAVDGIFYRHILKWAGENQQAILEHTKGVLSPADRKRIEAEKAAAEKTAAKEAKKKRKKEKQEQKEKEKQEKERKVKLLAVDTNPATDANNKKE